MRFHKEKSEIYIPDQTPLPDALVRTTDLCIAAHQDDIEIMAARPIIECFHHEQRWFSGVVLTDGRGSPRDGIYRHTSDGEMQQIRKMEQRKAAYTGEYGALVQLDYPSTEIKDSSYHQPVEDLIRLLQVAKPKTIYTHNLADKHDTHVAVSLRVIAALRMLTPTERPEKIFGCEVWRSLDWVNDFEKVVMDLSTHENLQQALLSVYDSQIVGGKRYDLATMNRRQANATFFESHQVDVMLRASFAMDLTPLVNDPNIQPSEYIHEFIHRFETDVMNRIARMS